MFNNLSKMMFMTIMMMGTIMAASSTTWLGAWMGLEINLLAFIPLMTASSNMMSSEAALKYFLTQALASSMLLMSVIMSSMMYWTHEINSSILTLSAIMMKLGAAPFHWWFPSVIEGLSWTNSMIMMTWQKIAPFMLMSYLVEKENEILMMTSMMLSAAIGALGGLNQLSLRKIMAYSSINHMGWMMAALSSSDSMWTMYMIMYSILTVNIIMMFKTMNLSQLNQMYSSMFESKTLKFCIMMGMLSLGGLPPFMGFLPKMIIIQALVNNSQIMIMVLLTMLSLITLFFYLRMAHSAFMINFHETSWSMQQNHKKNEMSSTMILSFISNSGMLSISMIYFMA